MKTTINNCGNIYENPIGDMINQIVIQVTETHEKFIFETIKPWCEEQTQMVISKDELVKALLFYRNKDKMLAEIRNEAWTLNNDEIIRDYVIDLPDVLNIVNKYCGMENKDGKQI